MCQITSPVECAAPKDTGRNHPHRRNGRKQGLRRGICRPWRDTRRCRYGLSVGLCLASLEHWSLPSCYSYLGTLHVQKIIVGTEKRKNRLLESAAVLKQAMSVKGRELIWPETNALSNHRLCSRSARNHVDGLARSTSAR